MTDKTENAFFYGWIIVVASFMAMSAQAFSFSFGVFYRPVMNQFGWTAANVALGPSIFSIMNVLAVLPVSWAYQRSNIRRIIITGGILMGMGLALSSLTTSLWQLYLCYGVLAGVGSSTVWVPFTSALMKWFVHRRGLVMGLATSGSGLGSFLYAALLSHIIATEGWRSAFLSAGLFSFLIMLVAALLMRGSPEEIGLRPYTLDRDLGELRGGERAVSAGNLTFHEAMHGKNFWLLYALWLVSTFLTAVYTQNVVLFALGLGISLLTASLALGSMGLSGIIGRLLVGVFLDRIGIRVGLVFCCALTLLSAFMLLFTRNTLSLFLFTSVFGFAVGVRTVIEVPLANNLFGLTYLGPILGALETAIGVGGLLGPYLAGYEYDLTGGYSQIFCSCAILSVLCFAIATALKPSKYARGVDLPPAH